MGWGFVGTQWPRHATACESSIPLLTLYNANAHAYTRTSCLLKQLSCHAHASRPWLAEVVREPPSALEPPPAPTRRRPLIYVYDLEPMYQSKILQYRYGLRYMRRTVLRPRTAALSSRY